MSRGFKRGRADKNAHFPLLLIKSLEVRKQFSVLCTVLRQRSFSGEKNVKQCPFSLFGKMRKTKVRYILSGDHLFRSRENNVVTRFSKSPTSVLRVQNSRFFVVVTFYSYRYIPKHSLVWKRRTRDLLFMEVRHQGQAEELVSAAFTALIRLRQQSNPWKYENSSRRCVQCFVRRVQGVSRGSLFGGITMEHVTIPIMSPRRGSRGEQIGEVP